MGKKKITTPGAEEAVKSDQSAGSASKKSSKRQVINGIAHISVSYNNTLVAISDLKGEIIAWSSAGSLGFKGTKKSTPYAANMVAKDCAEKAKKYNLASLKIIVKGVGPGREAAMRGLAATGLNVLSIMDATPMAHNGTRARKPRRI